MSDLIERLEAEQERIRTVNIILSKLLGRAASRLRELEAERDAIEAKTRERALALCDGWLERFADGDIKYTSATEYASGAVRDIRDAIRALKPSEGRAPINIVAATYEKCAAWLDFAPVHWTPKECAAALRRLQKSDLPIERIKPSEERNG